MTFPQAAGQQKPAANPFRNVAQSVRAAGLYPAWRGFESFRSDLPGLGISTRIFQVA